MLPYLSILTNMHLVDLKIPLERKREKKNIHWILFSKRHILLITEFPILLRLPMPRLLDSCARKCRGERSRCNAFVYTSPHFWPHWFPSKLKQMSLCTAHHHPIKTKWPTLICWTPTRMLTWPHNLAVLGQRQVSAVSPLRLMVLNVYATVLPSGHVVGEQRNLSNSSFPLSAKTPKAKSLMKEVLF